ncbi:hypothetical protein EJ03DRAFT_182821 [Teratosphaeria nubilosa]|uniref:Uncharacterized protein n=1 Tax=Teratosphaeria nubilosa TaxID=161662 RepID=A0A6G1L1J9_9PEZI|nr:hypothetical protein EJ03DRAFT_182821 [Teratosphaeria nubilosa]
MACMSMRSIAGAGAAAAPRNSTLLNLRRASITADMVGLGMRSIVAASAAAASRNSTLLNPRRVSTTTDMVGMNMRSVVAVETGVIGNSWSVPPRTRSLTRIISSSAPGLQENSAQCTRNQWSSKHSAGVVPIPDEDVFEGNLSTPGSVKPPNPDNDQERPYLGTDSIGNCGLNQVKRTMGEAPLIGSPPCNSSRRCKVDSSTLLFVDPSAKAYHLASMIDLVITVSGSVLARAGSSSQ